MLDAMTAAALAAWTATVGPSCDGAKPVLQEYRMDAGHSITEFSIRFAFSRVKGRITEGNGTILYDPVTPAASSISVVLNTKSLDTGWPHRDEHLRTSDFFDVEKFPTIEFRSTRLSETGDGWNAEGDLTMHGVTKRVAIPFQFTQPPTRSPESRWMILNVAGSTRLSRLDFGILGGSAFNSWFDKARAATMGDSVDIEIELEGYWPDAASQRSPQVEAALQRIVANGVPSQIARLDSASRTWTPAQAAGYLTGYDYVVRALIATCRIPDAAALAGALARLYPESHRAALIQAFTLGVSGDPAGADRKYAEGKRLFRPPVRDPNEKFPQDDDTWWYLDQLARTAHELGYRAEVVPLARAIAELYPQTARAMTTYGQALAAVGDAKGASTAYSRALEIDPRESRAMEWRRRLGSATP